MQLLRKLLGWNFAVFAVVSILGGCWHLINAIHRHDASLPIRMWLYGVLSVEAAVSVVAWWMIWKAKPAARFWGVAGSVILILDSIYFYIQTSRILWVMLLVGLIGVVAFLWRDETADIASHQNPDSGSESF